MNKVTVIEVQVGVSVKEGEDAVAVLEKVSREAQNFKEKLGTPEVFNVQMRDVPVQEQ